MDRSERVRAIAVEQARLRGPLLPLLHAVMDEWGWIDLDTDVAVIADVLNLSTAEVFGVISFYHDFRTTPPPPHRIALCRGEACQAVGAGTLWQRREAWAQPDVEVAEVFCLGNCALGPAAMIDGRLVGRADEARLGAVGGKA